MINVQHATDVIDSTLALQGVNPRKFSLRNQVISSRFENVLSPDLHYQALEYKSSDSKGTASSPLSNRQPSIIKSCPSEGARRLEPVHRERQGPEEIDNYEYGTAEVAAAKGV